MRTVARTVRTRLRNAQGYVVTGIVPVWQTSTSAIALSGAGGDSVVLQGQQAVTGARLTAVAGSASGSVVVDVTTPLVVLSATPSGGTRDTLTRTQTRTVTAQVLDGTWQPVPGATVVWTTNVSGPITVTANANGDTVRLYGANSYPGVSVTATASTGGSATRVFDVRAATVSSGLTPGAAARDTLTRSQVREVVAEVRDHHNALMVDPTLTWTTNVSGPIALEQAAGRRVMARAVSAYPGVVISVTSSAGGSSARIIDVVDGRIVLTATGAGSGRDTLTVSQVRALRAEVLDYTGQPVPGATVTWSTNVSGPIAMQLGAGGDAAARAVSPYPGVSVSATSSVGGSATRVFDVLAAQVRLDPAANGGPRDTLTRSQSELVTARVYDHHGAVLPGATVSWATSVSGPIQLSAPTGPAVQAYAANDYPGVAVSATTSAGGSATRTIFVVPAVLSVAARGGPPAGGRDTLTRSQERQLVARVQDHHGLLLPGANVTWRTNVAGPVVLSVAGADSTVARAVQAYPGVAVSASSSAGGSATQIIDVVEAQVRIGAPPAGSRDTLTRTQERVLSAEVRDHRGQVLPGATVSWRTNVSGPIALAGSTGPTMTARAMMTYPGVVVSATSDAGGSSTYLVDVVDARVALAPSNACGAPDVLAKGQSRSIAAVVTDHRGVALPDVSVTWTLNVSGVVSLSAFAGRSVSALAVNPYPSVIVSAASAGGGVASHCIQVIT